MPVPQHPCLQNPIALPSDVSRMMSGVGEDRINALVQSATEAFPEWRPPPFRPELFARLLDVPVTISAELREWDALLVPLRGRYRIVCRADVTPGRQRFSIAHELAHLFFERSSETDLFMRARDREKYYTTDEARRLERACDALAAEMLMPRRWFEGAVSRCGLRAGAVPELAGEFEVSLEAAALRLLDVRDEPGAVGFFEFCDRPSAPAGNKKTSAPGQMAYRARRVFRARGFPYLFPEGKSVPRSSVIHRASLGRCELEAVEDFTLGDCTETLQVQAFPLHRGREITEPPRVCAVLRPHSRGGACFKWSPVSEEPRAVRIDDRRGFGQH